MSRTNLLAVSALVLSVLVLLTAQANAAAAEKWALIVGVDRHASSGMKTDWAAKRAKDFQELLVKDAGFQPDHVNLLLDENATREKFLANFGGGMLHSAKPEDLVLVFIAGTGTAPEMDPYGESYFCAYDTEGKNLFSSGIALQILPRMITSRLMARNIILIVDASHSGSALTKDVGLRRMPAGASSVVLSSSRANEKSYGGVFTESLLTELKAKGPTAKLAEIFPIVRDRTEREVSKRYGAIQKPQLQKTGANELSLK
jgi:uncharacterized caspase-like protein